MKNVRFATSLVFSIVAVVSAETITLQQGTNGYTGCSDSYITGHYATVAAKYNTAGTLQIANGNYQWLRSGW